MLASKSINILFSKMGVSIRVIKVCNRQEGEERRAVGLTRQLQGVDYIKYCGSLCMEILTQFYDRICCEARPSYPVPYSFDFGNQEDLALNYRKFQNNQIKTTKYNLFNFIPKSIISQYKRLANLYFLIIAIISSVPNITPLNPALIWLPLIAVLFISIIKEAVEDYQRHKMDAEINNLNQVTVLRGGVEGKISWKDLKVGEICHIFDGETMPADIFLISTSNQDGTAFIETASLDGEKTSKTRYAFSELNNFKSTQNFDQFSGSFWGRSPNQSLDQFKGDIIYSERSKIQITDNRQLLFRGSKLKNTASVWGLVIYTGQCTKIMMNSQNFKTKISNVQKKLNYMLVCLLIVQIILCIIIASFAMVREEKLNDDHSYIGWGKKRSQGKMFIAYFFMYFIDFSSLIPVSLIVSIEIIKLAQSYFIDFDKLMFSKEKDRGVLAKCAALNEELGQIQYVFTDKTGTLTRNKMIFHTAIIGNSKYEFKYNEDTKIYQCTDLQDQLHTLVPEILEEKLLMNVGMDTLRIQTEEDLINHYLFCLLVCNHVTSVGAQQTLVYESESPDELALINAAKQMGYKFIKREKSNICVSIHKQPQNIKILEMFPFSSQRKRMSVMIQWNNRIILYTKGADNVISQRINPSKYTIQTEVCNISKTGLRTLMIAMKVIDKEEYSIYKKQLEQCTHNNRQSLQEEFIQKIQQNMELIGATGLLDELQEGVPQTLKDLQRAKIKIWMLTGDKFETAYEVAKSCKLIEPTYEVIECKTNEVPIKRYIDTWQYDFNDKKQKKYSLVIQGSRLAQIMNDDELVKQFTNICVHFETVICCRMLPIQKAEVVKLIRRNLNKVCLSIGDGGNDVSMIKQANIGVGIYGQQGMNAVQASDYAIPQFRMIWRLLFVHGRWNYIRISEMILYFTYKSILFTVPRIIFSFICSFSGQPIYDDYYIALYNVLFTSMPLIIRALFDQDINYIYKKAENPSAVANIHKDKSLESLKQSQYLPPSYGINNMFRKLFPKAYFIGQNNQIFNVTNCSLWIIESIIISTLSTLIIIYVIGSRTMSRSGQNSDLWIVSVSIYSSIIVIATLKLAIHVRHWTLLIAFSIIFCSLGPYLTYIWISNTHFSHYRIEGTIIMSFKTASSYLTIILVSCLMIMINSIIIYSRFHKNKLVSRMQMIMKEVESERKGDSVIEEDLMSDQYIHRSRRNIKERREDLEIEMKVVQIRFKEEEADVEGR